MNWRVVLMSKPIAVLISDVHYNLHTLELADKAMRLAIDKANTLQVPLIVAGDLHDSKANMRAECINAMLTTFSELTVKGFVLVGNHDKINEKSENHALHFLNSSVTIIDTGYILPGLHLIPYHHNISTLKMYLKDVPKNSTLIMHQGLQSSNSGEYYQDRSALDLDDVKDFRVISGHYHARQTIGSFDYIGNPYTLNFGEANDLEKGFQVLHSDGHLEFIPTNLRKHVIITHDISTNKTDWSSGPAYAGGGRNDIIWVKVSGTKQQLFRFNHKTWLKDEGIPQNVRISFYPLDSESRYTKTTKQLTQNDLLDNIIDSKDLDPKTKAQLKEAWKKL